MRTDQSDNNQGGTKKFLYSGPQPREQHHEDKWNFSNGAKKPSSDFDMDEVWSIKKNVSLGKPPAGNSQTDGLNLNVKKNYYSRYGNLKENDNGPGATTELGKTWNSQHKSRFSYASSGGLDPTGGRLSHGSNHSDDSLTKQKTGQMRGAPMSNMGSRYF